MRNAPLYQNVQIVPPDDAEYVAFMRRMSDLRPSRGGPRAAGEVMGGLIERCVRHWLSAQVPLSDARILTWEQRLKNGRQGRLYRELDAVWSLDAESLCLFEMKMTYAEKMQGGVGLKQLDTAAEILFASGRYRYVLKRLIYVAAVEKVAVLDGDIVELAPNDEFAEEGVVWVAPEEVEAAALELEIELPANWREPESREGRANLPEEEEWRQYAGDAEKAAVEDDEIAPPSDDNPLAAALRRALQKNN